MSGPRVKILKNGMVNRDVSGLGVDHLNDIDLNDIEQIEIVKGPSSLLYANGTIGGIINVVDIVGNELLSFTHLFHDDGVKPTFVSPITIDASNNITLTFDDVIAEHPTVDFDCFTEDEFKNFLVRNY